MYYIIHSQEIKLKFFQVDLVKAKPENKILISQGIESEIMEIEAVEVHKSAVSKLLKYRQEYCKLNTKFNDYTPRYKRSTK